MSTNIIIQAARFAHQAHAGQFRKFGSQNVPYIVHPGRVASRLCRHTRVNEDMVAAAWLHDVIEDTKYGWTEIAMGTSAIVADLVQELTNASKGTTGLNRAARKKMDREKIATISEQAKIVKLADRIDNLQDLDGAKTDFIRAFLTETKLLLSDSLHDVDKELEAECRAAMDEVETHIKYASLLGE